MSHQFIGEPSKQIFVSCIPARRQPSQRAVLLCYPFGQEYMRAHKAFRQLATLLARQGVDVYRFDYPCSGDSYGEGKDFSFEQCVTAGHKVLEHIAQTQSYTQMDIAGLRFGGLVAAALASSTSQKAAIKHLLLWDAFIQGQAFVDEMAVQCGQDSASTQNWNVHGYELSQAMRSELAEIDVAQYLPDIEAELHLLLSSETKQSTYIEQSPELKQSTATQKLYKKVIGPANDWNFVDTYGSILMPSALVKGIVQSLTH